MIEGSGSGYILLTNGSRFRRPKNIRFRIRNTENEKKIGNNFFKLVFLCTAAWSGTDSESLLGR